MAAAASLRWVLQLHRDVPKAAKLYSEGLGFKINVCTLRWAELEIQPGPLKLALLQSSTPNTSDNGAHKGYSSLLSFSVTDINTTVSKLIALGAELDGPIKHEFHGKEINMMVIFRYSHVHPNEIAMESELKHGLTCLKALLLFVSFVTKWDEIPRLKSLLSRIVNGVRRIPEIITFGPNNPTLLGEIVHEVVSSKEELVTEWYATMSHHTGRSSSSLTPDEAVALVGSILENAADFQAFEEEAVDVFEQEITFLKIFLFFAKRTGIDHEHLHKLLIYIEPFAENAARVFIREEVDPEDADEQVWAGQVQYRCLVLNNRPINCQVYQAYSIALSTSKLSSNALLELDVDGDDILHVLESFLGSLILLLWNVLQLDASHLVSLKDQLGVLYARLRSSRTILKKVLDNFHDRIKDQIGALICDAGVLICSLHLEDVKKDSGLSDLLHRFDVIQQEIEDKASQTDSEFNSLEADSDLVSFDLTSTVKEPGLCEANKEEIGFQEEAASILDQLTRGSKQLRIVTISGMAGLGKTTLALKVYNDPSVMRHFHARAWWPISQVLNKKNVFLRLLNQIQPGSYLEMTEDDLANKLRQSLKGRRYLIFLDDVWTLETWYSLQESFLDDLTQSRIILTSRHCDIVPHSLLKEAPHLIRLRGKHESLELLEAKLFPKKGWPEELNDLGMQILEKCKGLPLMIVAVAGLLAVVKQEDWKGIVDALTSEQYLVQNNA